VGVAGVDPRMVESDRTGAPFGIGWDDQHIGDAVAFALSCHMPALGEHGRAAGVSKLRSRVDHVLCGGERSA
jgi:hypothetical protein